MARRSRRSGAVNMDWKGVARTRKLLRQFPDAPDMTLTPASGGFGITLAAVSGAERYEVRYRPTGGNSTTAWTRLTDATLSESVTAAAGTYDVQSWVRTADGLSQWSTVETVTVS